MKYVIHPTPAMLMVNQILLFIERMPLSHGVITMLGVGILAGTYLFGGIQDAVALTKVAAVVVVVVLGSLTLWMLWHDRRRERRLLAMGVSMAMASNLVIYFQYQQEIFFIAHNISVIVIMMSLYLVAWNGYKKDHCVGCRHTSCARYKPKVE